ncbi:MAG: DUF445 domain-containing protein [Desulfitobacterium sp.]|nr:DUF445 domain-containing protein [Desulfitobacterium sp.]
MSTEEKNTNSYPTKQKANIALALSALGLLVAFPFQGSFWGGLLTSGCGAALVGGLADWFAVNALFRRPLGIPNGRVFRTEIIPRNRKKIFRALSTMVEEELLPQEALKEKLKNYDYFAPIASILSSAEREKLANLSQDIIQHLTQHILFILQQELIPENNTLTTETQITKAQSTETLTLETLTTETSAIDNNTTKVILAVEIDALLKNDDFQQKLTLHLEKALQDFLHSKEGESLIREFIFTLKLWLGDTEVHFWLTHWLEDAIERYIERHPSRRILAIFLPNPSELAQLIQNKISSYLMEEETIKEIKIWLANGIERTFRPKLLQEPIEPSKEAPQKTDNEDPLENFSENTSISSENIASSSEHISSTSEYITEKLTKNIADHLINYLQTNSLDKERKENFTNTLEKELTQKIDKTLLNLQEDLLKRHIFNTKIYNLLLPLIERKHGHIKVMIYEGLQEYSGEELTELIESKAGDDLQMIRINGSIIGGLVGILIYLVNGLFI